MIIFLKFRVASSCACCEKCTVPNLKLGTFVCKREGRLCEDRGGFLQTSPKCKVANAIAFCVLCLAKSCSLECVSAVEW